MHGFSLEIKGELRRKGRRGGGERETLPLQ